MELLAKFHLEACVLDQCHKNDIFVKDLDGSTFGCITALDARHQAVKRKRKILLHLVSRLR